MTSKILKAGEHPMRKKALKATARGATKLKKTGALKTALGRPVRMDAPQKTTIHLALALKRKAFDLACQRRCSIGRLIEDLIAGCKG